MVTAKYGCYFISCNTLQMLFFFYTDKDSFLFKCDISDSSFQGKHKQNGYENGHKYFKVIRIQAPQKADWFHYM